MHTPASLPFRQEKNYVPIERSVLDVQRELEDVDGQQVVTVHAGPQLGKTSFVKHIALDIEERETQGTGTSFPDGVYYLSCGQRAKNKVEQLQLELLQGLGFGTPVRNDVIMAGGLQGQLIACLRNKKLLIILDDLRDEKVLEELLVPSKGVRYLVTSRNKDIWIPARKIELQRPTEEEANQILANYIEGNLPDDIQTWSHSLVRMVEMHPKALANIGLSMSRNSHARNTRHWENRLLKARCVYGGKWFARITWAIAVCLLFDNLVMRPNINRGVQTHPVYGLIIAAFFLLFSLHILPQLTEYWGSVPGFRQNALVSSIVGLPYGQKVILFFSFLGMAIADNLLGIALLFDDHGALDVGTSWVSLTMTRITLAIHLLGAFVCTSLIAASVVWLGALRRDDDVTANSLSALLSMAATCVDVATACFVLDTIFRRFQ